MLDRMLRAGNSIARSLSVPLLVLCIFGMTAHAVDKGPAQRSVTHRRTPKKPAPLVLPPLPAGPLAQIPMDQLPAAAPKVTYENGLLSITAQNATLGEILRNVRQLTGATIDVPATGANERVVVQLGPGAPRDVLAALLNGTSFNYVMLGSASDPKSVASVVLTSRPGGGEVQTAVNTVVEGPTPFQQQQTPMPSHPMPPAFRGPGFAQPPQPVAADDDADDSSDADDKDDDSDQPQQQVQPVQPTLGQADNQDQGGQPNAGPKTPEQILQMIREGQRPVPPGVPPQQQQPPDE
jgi:hypothetical protein